jgi:hypothetical protein
MTISPSSIYAILTLLRGLPKATIGEVSRFALPKDRGICISADVRSLLRLALIQGAVWLSAEAGHTHWLAVMEPTLLRLLRATGLHFVPVGPPVVYHGLRSRRWRSWCRRWHVWPGSSPSFGTSSPRAEHCFHLGGRKHRSTRNLWRNNSNPRVPYYRGVYCCCQMRYIAAVLILT